MDDILHKIKVLLADKNLTHEQFGKKIGVTKQTVTNYFNKRSKIDVIVIKRIADLFDVPVSYFFGESAQPICTDQVNDHGSKFIICPNCKVKSEEILSLKAEKDRLLGIIENMAGTLKQDMGKTG